jgi:dienelactone hydrolase
VLIRVFAVVATACAAATSTAASTTAPGLRVLRLVDASRYAHFRNGAVARRTLVTYVRYPRAGSGPYPLVVFAHGFALTPAPYAPLLDAWARAGYVVAAPVFPVENANAPGGPDESDLVNQPADISFVITRLLTGPLHDLIDPRRIAVAGHSDGAETALAVAYADRFRDPRVDAAVILSGAQLPNERFTYGPARPPLLAVQGTADTINPRADTSSFFRLARAPKFLLWLLHAGHLPPYTTDRPELTVVERVTTAFLDHTLGKGSLKQLLDAGRSSRLARLAADP